VVELYLKYGNPNEEQLEIIREVTDG